jgi:hypothetical protein
MSISFTCEHCGKKVQAPDEAGGRRGKCPFCQGSNYIPDPQVSEDIPLAPIDEEEERRRREEERRLQEQEEALIAESGGEPAAPSGGESDVASEELHQLVVNYCLAMSESNLEQAEDNARRLAEYRFTGLKAVDDFLSGDADKPALKDLPPQLLKGFLDRLKNDVRNYCH